MIKHDTNFHHFILCANANYFYLYRMKYVYPLLLVLVFIMSACDYDKEWTNKNIGNRYTISVPGYLKEVNDLRKDASFQYANRYRNVYLIVFEKQRTKMDLTQFDSAAILPLLKYVSKPLITDSLDVMVNGLPSLEKRIMGEMNSGDGMENIYYDHLSIRGKQGDYEVCTWTRGPKRQKLYQADMARMIFSFKEL